MWTTIMVLQWTGIPFSDEQMLVLRNVAAKHMRGEDNNPVVSFSHKLIEGHITRGNVYCVGSIAGTRFSADLGTVGGVRWSMDFILPFNTERIEIQDDSVVISTKTLPDGRIGISKINHTESDIE